MKKTEAMGKQDCVVDACWLYDMILNIVDLLAAPNTWHSDEIVSNFWESLLTRLVYRINDGSRSNISTGYFSEYKAIGYHAGQSLVQITTSKSLLQTFFVTIVINFCIRWWHFVNSSKFVGASRPQSNKTSDSIKFESHTTLPFRSPYTTWKW